MQTLKISFLIEDKVDLDICEQKKQVNYLFRINSILTLNVFLLSNQNVTETDTFTVTQKKLVRV